MPDRIIRPGILTSDAVNTLSAQAEVFYRRLMSVVDDYGRFDGRTTVLRAVLFPLQLDKVSEPDIVKWILATGEAGLVRRYTFEGKPFLQIEKFGQKIRSKSKWPDPPTVADNCQQMSADVPVVVFDVVCEGGAAKPPPPSKPKGRKTAIPEDFTLSDRVRSWAAERGHTDLLELHFEAFVSTCRAKGYEYADWDEALMVAIRKNWAGLTSPKTGDWRKDSRFVGAK